MHYALYPAVTLFHVMNHLLTKLARSRWLDNGLFLGKRFDDDLDRGFLFGSLLVSGPGPLCKNVRKITKKCTM